MKNPALTALFSLLVLGTLVAGCELLQSPAKPSATTQSRQPDQVLGSFAVSPRQGRESVDWARFISTSAGQGRIKSLQLTTAALAPGAPFNLTFNTASSTVSLSWNAPSGGDPPTSYVVEAGSASGLANLASFDTGSALTSLSVNNVPTGQYFVRVKATNSSGLSPASNEVLIVVGGSSCAVPAAPTNLRSCVAGTNVSLTWSGSPGATSYFLEAGSSPGASNLYASDIGSGGSLTATAVPGTYYVRLKAKSPCGTSAASNEIILTAGGTPVVDQSYLPDVALTAGGLPNFNGSAQTFTVGISGGLSAVGLRFISVYNNVRMQIRSTSGGVPTSQVLADTRIPSTIANAPVRVDISSFGICVNPGDVLAIVLPPISAGNSSVALWNITQGVRATYDRGQGFQAADNGASSPINQPVGGIGGDYAFETYVTR